MLHSTTPTFDVSQGSVPLHRSFPVTFESDAADGLSLVKITGSSAKPVLLEIFAEVITAFSTGVLTFGTDAASADQLIDSDDLTEGTPGFYPAANAVVKLRAISDTEIFAKLTGAGGVAQVETATAAGDVSGAGDATVTITSAIVTGSPLAVSVPVTTGDTTGALIAGKIRAVLAATAAVTAHFAVSGAGAEIILTALTAAANDATLNIAIATGTATGVTPAASSANTTAGVAPLAAGAAELHLRITPLF